jgi:hypothetical protein
LITAETPPDWAYNRVPAAFLEDLAIDRLVGSDAGMR